MSVWDHPFQMPLSVRQGNYATARKGPQVLLLV